VIFLFSRLPAGRYNNAMKNILFLIIASILVSPLAGLAQAPTQISEKEFTTELDAYIRRSMEAVPEIPSIAMVVVKGDKPIFTRAYGLANKESGTQADVNTLYYTGSLTKSYTALAAALLDREGKIKLSNPMAKYAPGVTFKSPIPEKITIQNLLTHTSALRNGPLIFRTAFSGEIDDKDIMRVFAEGTTFNEQNYGKYAYTNLGYNIYGLLLKLSLQKKWQDVLQEKVFGPLGLRQTSASVSKPRAAKLTIANPYLFSPDTESVIRAPIEKQDNNMQEAGGIVTSISDLGRWLNVNMNNGKIEGRQVIPADVMEKVHTAYVDATYEEPPFAGNGKYSMGWLMGKSRGENVVFHDGGYPGWYCHVSYMPDKKFGVALLVNENVVGRRVGQLLAGYAYDRWLAADTPESYVKQLQDITTQFGRIKQQMIASVKSRAGRTSQLTRPLADYTGRYSNEMQGNIDIVVEQNTLAVRMGYINVVSTPFTQKDTIRVEMLPGQGEVIGFGTNTDGKIDSLTYAGLKFVRANR
jgi:CubicO group peptidase (beta-lactamase class C family)